MITLSIRGLPRTTSEETLTTIFSEYGAVRSVKLAKDIFSGECKGFATLDMEGHQARAAMSGLNNSDLNGNLIRVEPFRQKKGRGGKRH